MSSLTSIDLDALYEEIYSKEDKNIIQPPNSPLKDSHIPESNKAFNSPIPSNKIVVQPLPPNKKAIRKDKNIFGKVLFKGNVKPFKIMRDSETQTTIVKNNTTEIQTIDENLKTTIAEKNIAPCALPRISEQLQLKLDELKFELQASLFSSTCNTHYFVFKYIDLYDSVNNPIITQKDLESMTCFYPKELIDLCFNKIKDNSIAEISRRVVNFRYCYEFSHLRCFHVSAAIRWCIDNLLTIKFINGEEKGFYCLNEDQIVFALMNSNGYNKRPFKRTLNNFIISTQNPFVLENLLSNYFFAGNFEKVILYIEWLFRCFIKVLDFCFSGRDILENYDEIIKKRKELIKK